MTRDQQDTANGALRCVVCGRVQGVGFRLFVVEQARAMGLTGWVRNLADGRSVELVAEGPRAELVRLQRAVASGPAGATVDEVSCEWIPAGQGFSDFGVRR